MRTKHRNDKNHGRDGWVGGNPRYGRNRGHRRGNAPQDKATVKATVATQQQDKAEEERQKAEDACRPD